MWTLLFLLLMAPRATQAQDDRLILKNGSNPCDGLLMLYHNGMLRHIGASDLSEAVRKVACRSTECGKPVTAVNMQLPENNGNFWMDLPQCKGDENHLWNCNFSRWDLENYRMHKTQRLTCSDNIDVSLEESQCHGQVRYSRDGGANRTGFICGDDFNEKEANVLCKSLGCGGLKKIPDWSSSTPSSDMISTKCIGTEERLWECAPKQKKCNKPAYVYCQGHQDIRLKGNTSDVCSGEVEVKRDNSWIAEQTENATALDLWCQQMFCGGRKNHITNPSNKSTLLNCKASVQVLLLPENNKNKCYGTVYVEKNHKRWPVCATKSWTDANSEVICKELGCGKSLMWKYKTKTSKSVLDDVRCDSTKDSSLWHCPSKHTLNEFQCNRNIHVICSDSMEVRLADGPSHCSGRLELKFEGQWQAAQRRGWNDASQMVVCHHLDCGELLSGRSNLPRFVPRGPHQFLDKTFICNDKTLPSCTINDLFSSKDEKIVDITCSKHADVFLTEGVCSGYVQVQDSSKLYWLSASSDVWNKTAKAVTETLCTQRGCGSVYHYELKHKKDRTELPLWTLESCPSPTDLTSFAVDCKYSVTNLALNSSVEIAWVNCTGSKTVNLTKQCLGFVQVCEKADCGGVCAEAWTDDSSQFLCKSLECGGNIALKTEPNTNLIGRYSNLHLRQNGSTMVRLTNQSCKLAYVGCTGSYGTVFDQPRDYCSGNVQLSQEENKLSVCKDVLEDKNVSDIICAERGCGSFLSHIPHYGLTPNTSDVPKLRCENNHHFNSCTALNNVNPCLGFRGLRCSAWRQVVLVQSAEKEDGCSGVVFVYSKQPRAAVTSEGWSLRETERLCRDLGCGLKGSHRDAKEEEQFLIDDFWNGTFNCTAAQDPQSLWQCVNLTLPEKKQQLHVECMPERPMVELSDGCSGRVLVHGVEVCNSSWEASYSQLLCEKRCGGVAITFMNTMRSASKKYQHVHCEKHHDRLEQCQHYEAPCTGSLVSVICSNEIKVQTSKATGGDIEVKFGNNPWEKVCSESKLPEKIQERLCAELNCTLPQYSPNVDTTKTKLNFSLKCIVNDHQDIRHCLSRSSCSRSPATVSCPGCIVPTPTPPPPRRVNVIGLSLGLILVLGLVLGFVLFLRFYLHRHNKSLKQLLPVCWRVKEKDLKNVERGDNVDVASKDPDTLPLQPVRGGATDKESISSQSYDNIDELTRPLTCAPLHPTADSDGTDSYDDIDVSPKPEQLQVTADVHFPPPSSPEQLLPPPTEGGGGVEAEGERGKNPDLPTEGGGGVEAEGERGKNPDLPTEGGEEVEAEGETGDNPDLVLGEDDYLVPPEPLNQD